MSEYTIIVGDFNILLSEMDTECRKLVRNIVIFNNMIDQLGIQISRLLYPTQQSKHSSEVNMEYLPRQSTFWAIKHKFKRIEKIHYVLSDRNGIKLETNNKKKTGKSQNRW